jgi:hypothetical protein
MSTVKSVGYKCMPGGNPHNRPVLMKDGKVIDQDATVIEDKVIADGMRYIVKMTKGLATGVMSQDEEYIELQNKILKDLIKEKSSDIRKEIETSSRLKIRAYADAHKCHQKALDKMQALSAQTAKENSISFFVNDDNQVYRYGSNSPVGMTANMGGGWTRIDLKDLKKNIEAREKATAEYKKKNGPQTTHEKIDDALAKFNKKKSKTKKKVVEKRTPKKRNAKKKVVKAKKRDKK